MVLSSFSETTANKESFKIMDIQMSNNHHHHTSTGGSYKSTTISNNASNSSKPIHIHTTLYNNGGGKKKNKKTKTSRNLDLDDDEQYDNLLLEHADDDDSEGYQDEEEDDELELEDENYSNSIRGGYSGDDNVEVVTSCLEGNLIIKDSYSSQITPETMQQHIQKSKYSSSIGGTSNLLVEHKIESFNITPIKPTHLINNTSSLMNTTSSSFTNMMPDDSQISISPSTPPMNQSFLDSLVNSGSDSISPIINNNNNNNNCGISTTPGINLDLVLSQIPVSTTSDIAELFTYFRNYKPTFGAMKREPEFFKYQGIVNQLFEKDYVFTTISNKEGELCATYPPELIVIEKEKDIVCDLCNHNHQNQIQSCINNNNNNNNNLNNNNQTGGLNNKEHLQKLISQSRFARVRTRFPFPVIYYHRKNICRSSTLSQKIEYMLQSSVNTMKKQFQSTVPSISPTITASIYGGTNNNNPNGSSSSSNNINSSSNNVSNDNILTQSTFNKLNEQQQQSIMNNHDEELSNSTVQQQQQQLPVPNNSVVVVEDDGNSIQNMEYLRNRDILVIKHLNIRYICDLMVENKKKKFGFFVCSSEKVDMHKRYQDFVIASTPYPGVEFFAEFTKNKHNAKDLIFQWDNTEDPALLNIQNHTDGGVLLPSPINWDQYKTWDLIYLTQNYFKLLLKYISDDSTQSGLLVHCISGWDRTPLFISLIRLSLWADGEIHNSLESWEMLILTVAYDWFLFSHQLSDRSSRGEDIFYFCFYFLEYIISMDFSIHTFNKVSTQQQSPISVNNNGDKSTTPPINNNSPSKTPYNNDKKSCNNHRNNNNNNNNSWGKSFADASHSAPVTPQNNSPKILIGMNKMIQNTINNNTSNQSNNNVNYISAPSTPSGSSPLKEKSTSHLSKISPNLTSTTPTTSIPVDVPNSAQPKKRRSSEEEIGGSWQLMGSLNEHKKSSLNSLGSTPTNQLNHHHFHPSSSYNSVSEASDHDDEYDSKGVSTNGNRNNTTNTEDEDSSDCMTFSFEQDATKHLENFNIMRQQQQQQQHQQPIPPNNNNNNSKTLPIPTHHSNGSHLTFKEIEERRRQRLLEIRNLFVHFYQNHCFASESYWSKFLTSYFPKFG